ncbi:polyisoprenoid-binding protein YceI [Scopulibacillus darangshiensis]|uniref:Polyisoprenoid-binding protein YceI n=1 Tax=Scopulibacillus darangshiensis TaxID=442528 RepID=A0A4R2P315_9BACL|nr:YceI family protein [Scopulibacillus darangshiensis]TCP28967.1 polyisoprenoid-binding protein YceI [Scopulibacillus darangshiensis]
MAKSKWAVDSAHSSIDFSVKHMMVAKVKGSFNSFEGSAEADTDDLTTADVAFNIDVNSIDTRNADRDAHLKASDFFDVENYPTITFKSTDITKKGANEYDMTGDLTLHGTTRPETFALTFEGEVKDPMSGKEKAGFSGETKIKRSDFGLTWNAALETGGVMLGDEIKISIEIEATKEA